MNHRCNHNKHNTQSLLNQGQLFGKAEPLDEVDAAGADAGVGGGAGRNHAV